MKHLAIIAPHFVPSNLTAVHRARLLSRYLPCFGWRPTVIMVHEKFYEEALDWRLTQLLPEKLELKKAWAFSTRPVRLVGDIGIRGFWGMYKEIIKLHEADKIDSLLITIPSNYSALLGPIVFRKLKIPYGIDYIDPWISETPRSGSHFSKAGMSELLAHVLEPMAVSKVSLISGVAPAYYESVLRRNPHLKNRITTVAMPYGAEPLDYEYAKSQNGPLLFLPGDGKFHMIYAGAMLPYGYRPLEELFQALKELTLEEPILMKKFKLHFIGTGKSPDDKNGYNILPLIKKYSLESWIDEHPARIGYLDVLCHLTKASGILIIGSEERHYTPSKVFQALLSGTPVLAVLHEESSAVSILKQSGRGMVISFRRDQKSNPKEIKAALKNFVSSNESLQKEINWEYLEQFSAKRSAEALAGALDKVYVK